ncbi:MAG: C4-dicarboxylate ABC transporter substrate-binding protein [Betaproteobacteria bacterium]|nr:MAG: C4-dicarboxylate ABC transporter substrate-binding protein [Betaproteobacteria bacterium]
MEQTLQIARRLALGALGALLAAGAVRAAEPALVKIATIAPKHSIYHRTLQEIGEAYRRASGPQARTIVYPDSIQGTEADTVRRMRVGQLDASMLTVVGLSEIDPSVAALQYLPMMFRSWEELDYVRERLRPELEARLAAKGFVALLWGEGGWVQFFAKEPFTHPEEFKRARIFAWSGDKLQASVMKSQGYTPVPIPLADILPALETGMIDAVPVAPLWAMIGQFDRIARHMVRVNWVPIVGATVIRKQTFDALRPEARAAMLAAAARATDVLRAQRAVQDEESIRAMQARGLKVLPLTPEAEQAWRALAERSWPQVRGTLVPAETFDQVRALVAEYRGAQK